MPKALERFTLAELEAMYDTFYDSLARCEAFEAIFDVDLLCKLTTEEIAQRWQGFGFDAVLVEPSEVPGDVPLWHGESEEFPFLLPDDDNASEGKTAEENRREFAQLLHEELVDRSYDEQSLVAAVTEAVIEHGGIDAEQEAITHNYSNVRVAICGYRLPDFHATPGVEVAGASESMTLYNGRLSLDLAVWMVPLS